MKTDENGWNSFETQHTQHVLGLKRELFPLTVNNRGSEEDECLAMVVSLTLESFNHEFIGFTASLWLKPSCNCLHFA